MRQTEISEEYLTEFYDRISLKDTNGKFKIALAREDPSIFAIYMLGMRGDKLIRPYQDYFFQTVMNNKKVVLVKARQIGMSTAVGVFALWAALFNKYPAGLHDVTSIGIISKSDDSAKKLLNQYVLQLMHSGQNYLSRQFGDKWSNYFTDLVKRMNSEMIEFSKTISGAKNGSFIKSYPPTEKVRGETFSIVFIDEAAFLNNPSPKDYFYTTILPTVSTTGGKIIVLSTPNGVDELFYDLVDPFDKYDDHEFVRLFYPYTINDDKNYKDFVNLQREKMDPSYFAQEFECDFISSGSNFFSAILVDRAVDDRVKESYDGFGTVSVGVDLGWNESRTVVTVTWKDPNDGIIKLLEYKRFDKQTPSEKVLLYLEFLKSIYKIGTVVVDNCIQAKDFINTLNNKGYFVKEFDFHTMRGDKIPAYVKFRSLMNSGMLKFPKFPELIREMKELIQEETSLGMPSIHKPRRGSDDIIDSFVMSASVWFDSENEGFRVVFIE